MGLLNWGNALSKAGGALADVGLEGMKASLEEQKMRLADELAEGRAVRSHDRTVQAQIDAEKRAPINEGAMLDARAAATVRNAPALIQVKVDETKAVNAQNLNDEVAKFTALEPLKRKAAIDEEVARVKARYETGSTPEALKATRAMAMAAHIVDPSYQLIPQADGTVVTYDSRSNKVGGVLKDPDGKPIVRKDPEELKAATAILNSVNTNLRIAEAAYKSALADPDPKSETRVRAEVEWKAAREEADRQRAPAYAVLFRKGGTETPAAADGVARPTTQADFDKLAPGTSFVNPADGKTYTKKAAEGKGPVRKDDPAKVLTPAGRELGASDYPILNPGMQTWASQPKPESRSLLGSLLNAR